MASGDASVTFLLGSLLRILEGLAYLMVASLLSRRHVAGDLAVPARMFQAWWTLIGANKIASALAGLGAAAGWVQDPLYVAVIYLNVVVLCLSLWCLLSYFAYLRSGPPAVRAWITLLYVGYYLLLTYHIAASHPLGAEIGAWRANLVSAGEAPPLRQLLILAFLVLPQTIAAFSYLLLVRRVRDRTARFRISLVSVGILAWTGSLLLAALPMVESSVSLQVTSRFLGIGGALLGLVAYQPPGWLRRRLRVEAIAGPAAREPLSPRAP